MSKRSEHAGIHESASLRPANKRSAGDVSRLEEALEQLQEAVEQREPQRIAQAQEEIKRLFFES
jgi:predicted nuclease with TOPRIM domain